MKSEYIPVSQEPSDPEFDEVGSQNTPVRRRQRAWKGTTIVLVLLEAATLLWMYTRIKGQEIPNSTEGFGK